MDRTLSYFISGRIEGRALFADDLERIISEGYIGDTATLDAMFRLIKEARSAWAEEQNQLLQQNNCERKHNDQRR